MKRSRENFRDYVDEVRKRTPRWPPPPAYQKVFVAILIIAALVALSAVVFRW
jgi:hypothetical protein